MKLSKRLEHLAAMVSKNKRVADIGTDHGWLPIKLVLEGIATKAIAMDLREGPLSRAMIHIKEYGLEERIQTRLSDGMQELHKNEVDTIVIAGLGGELMIDILKERPDLYQKEFILSPHSEWKAVRQFLREQRMDIVDEDMVLDEKKYYIIIKTKGQKFHEDSKLGVSKHDDLECRDLFGPILIQKKHPVLRTYLEKEQIQYTRILQLLEQKDLDANGQARMREIKQYLDRIEKTWSEIR